MQEISVKIIYSVLCKDTIGIKYSVDKVFFVWKHGSMYAPT